jgi:hypothetical protein
MQRCPICRATYKGETTCTRCRADLAPLLKIEREAQSLARQAVLLFVAGKTQAAASAAQKSIALKNSSLAQAINALTRKIDSTTMD